MNNTLNSIGAVVSDTDVVGNTSTKNELVADMSLLSTENKFKWEDAAGFECTEVIVKLISFLSSSF
jgi:hypothetical protein